MTQIPALLLFASSFNLGYIQVPGEGWNAPDYGASYTPFAAESLNMTCYGMIQDTSYGIRGFDVSEDGDWVYGVIEDPSFDSWLLIYNVSDSTNPVEIARILLNHYTGGGCLINDTLLYTVSWVRFIVFNIKNPADPIYVSECDSGVRASDMVRIGNIVFCIYGFNTRFFLVDVSDPYNPERIYYENLSGSYADLFYHPSISPYLYVMRTVNVSFDDDNFSSYLYAYDVSDPSSPQLVDSFRFRFFTYPDYAHLMASKSIAIYTNPGSGKTYVWFLGGVVVCFDITDIHDPSPIGWWYPERLLFASDVHEDRAYITTYKGVVVYDLGGDPFNLSPIAYYDFDYFDYDCLFQNIIWHRNLVYATCNQRDLDKKLAIFHYTSDTLPDTANPYMEWIQTVYDRPGLRFFLKDDASVSFSLFSTVGQRVYYQDMGLLRPGLHYLEMPDRGAGVYFLFLKANDVSFSTRLVFTR